MKPSEDVNSWLEFAKYDLKAARWNFEGKLYTTTCYFTQQVAEKAIKAMLLSKGKIAPKVHSLDRLISELKILEITVPGEIETAARELDKYYITGRYPGEYGGPEGLYSEEEAQAAMAAAEVVMNFSLGAL
jgi:HEPN domain-containing protein